MTTAMRAMATATGAVVAMPTAMATVTAAVAAMASVMAGATTAQQSTKMRWQRWHSCGPN